MCVTLIVLTFDNYLRARESAPCEHRTAIFANIYIYMFAVTLVFMITVRVFLELQTLIVVPHAEGASDVYNRVICGYTRMREIGRKSNKNKTYI